MATVYELYELIDKEKSGKWSIWIFDLSGRVQFGYCNSVYPVTAIPEEILSAPVEKFSIGYESLYIKIDMSAKVYAGAEECVRDGYQSVYGNRYNAIDTLYSKKVDGMREFAVVDFLAGMRKNTSK